MSKSSEHCIFCGWNRRTCWQNIRFYNIPREPGLKRIRWLQVFGNRPITHRDRVCSVHFRSGRPSNDPSHEDFVPHLYLSKEPPPEVMSYFEQAADKESDCAKILAADASVELISKETGKQDDENDKDKDRLLLPLLPKKTRNFRPAIMQRKRKQIKDELIEDENVIIQNGTVNGGGRDEAPRLKKPAVNFDHQPRNELPSTYNYHDRKAVSKSNLNQYRRITNNTIPSSSSAAAASRTAIPLDRLFVQSTGIQAGQTLSIKRKTPGAAAPVRIPIIPRYHHTPIHNLQDPKVVYRVVTPRTSSNNSRLPMTSHRIQPPAASHYHHHLQHSSTQEEDLVNQQLRYIEMEGSRDDEELHMLEEEAETVRQMHEQEMLLQNHHQQMLSVSSSHHLIMSEFDDGGGTFEEYYEDGFEEYDQVNNPSDILSQHHHRQSRT